MLTALAPADGDAIISLDELKARVRLDDGEDALLTSLRAQAIDFVERYSGIALSRRAFLWADKQFVAALRFPVGPVAEVTEIKYYDIDGTDVTLDSDAWFLGGGMLSARFGTRWPYAAGYPGSVRITFTAGLESAETEAPMLVAAVAVGVAELYANREAPDWSAVMRCADQYRMPGL